MMRGSARPSLLAPLLSALLTLLCLLCPARADVPATAPSWHAAGVRGAAGMVVSAEEQASQAGAEVLRAGGNAVDAAVATAFALAVTWPEAGNIGGGGFWLGRDPAGHAQVYDFREVAPQAATPDLYVKLDQKGPNRASLEGPLASGVPGSVAGLYLAHKRGGKLPWARCLAPAIRLAREGMTITENIHHALAGDEEKLQKVPAAAAIFLPGGHAPAVGEVLKQPDLAQTLSLVAERGPEGFYHGPVAEKLAAWQKQAGGLITLADLAAYKAVPRDPLPFRFAGYDVLTVPPPASGATLATIAGMITLGGAERVRGMDAPAIHFIAEVERRAFADRNHYLGDPAFVKIPLTSLLSKAHMMELLAGIQQDRATPLSTTPAPAPGERGRVKAESAQTTHFSVVDKSGAAVSVTTTLNGSFGSGQVVPGAGFFMNNEMDDFATRPEKANMYGLVQGQVNEVRGGKRMLSSMCPAIAAQGGKLRLVWGTPGGSTIPTTNFQIMWHVLLRGEDLVAAQDEPRFHQQDRPDRMLVESTMPQALVDQLRAMGHEVMVWKWGRGIGKVNAVQLLPDGTRLGVTDPRGGGAAVAQ